VNESHVEHRGCRLAYDVVGSGPSVLFIQGVGVAGSGWLPQTEALASQFRCLTFDNRGLGRSQPAAAEISVEQMAEDALAILDAAGVEQAHVVGHSLGGPVALALAQRAPGRVRSLALLCTFTGARTAAPLSPRLVWFGLRSKIGTRAMRRFGFLGLVAAPGSLPRADRAALAERLGALFGHDIADQPAIAAAQLRALRRFDATGRLAPVLGIPSLVVSATHDPIAPPRAGLALAEALGARFVEVEDASHGLPITHAEVVNRMLVQFWEGTPLDSSSG
jgi:pimeloyl-ACP methyl ester carboxylesterase